MRTPLSLFALALLLIAGCVAAQSTPDEGARHPAAGDASIGDAVWVPSAPRASASSAFWEAWGDGRAELSSYRTTVMRYGEPREAETVFIYVTEPVDRATWIKDDAAEGAGRVNVLKLNTSLKFLTGIYPYSVMTTVLSPVDDYGRDRFTPAKIVLSSQEWCGIYTHLLWPGAESLLSTRLSYFANEGEVTERIAVPADLLYADALPLQLRELDGPFAGGGDWEGHVVPSLVQHRFNHMPLRPVPARITRADTILDGTAATRFVLRYDEAFPRQEAPFSQTYIVENDAPHHLLAWSTSDGDEAVLTATERLPYWQLNGPGDESYRAGLGVDTTQYRVGEF